MYDVVIAGAGPVGLWLARELRLSDIEVVVVESALERSPHSRALTIHPRTLEILAMRDVADDVLDEGAKIPSGHFALLDQRLAFDELDTRFPFTLALPQARTEELLERYALQAGAEIRRGQTVIGLDQDDVGVSVSIEPVGGGRDTVRARYVVGCDGTRSAVRECAGIGFSGTDASIVGYLGDVFLDKPPNGVFSKHGPDGTVMVARLPGGLHRFAGIDPTRQDLNAQTLRFEDFRDSVIRAAGTDFGMRDPNWLSYYRDAARQADTYRLNRVLLAGDAAHMHFPTGGVGMNVGIQDAMNLGWKLAAVVQNRATAELLDSYVSERHHVGLDVLEFSRAQAALMTAFSPAGQALRALLARLIGSNRELAHTLASRLSGLDVAYPPAAGDAHPLVGQRVPDLAIEGGGRDHQRLHQLLHRGWPLIVNNASEPNPTIQELEHLRAILYTGRLDTHGRAQWCDVAAVVVRPDGYVAWATDDRGALSEALDAAAASVYAA